MTARDRKMVLWLRDFVKFHIEDLVYVLLIGVGLGDIAVNIFRSSHVCAAAECRARAEDKRSQEMAKEFEESMNRSQR